MGVRDWFSRVLGADSHASGATERASSERLGDVPALRLRDVDVAQLDPAFRRDLAEACARDARILAVRLGWMSSGDAPPELLAVLTLDGQHEAAIAAFLARANALGGPRCAAVASNGPPGDRPFYRRRE